MNHVACGMAAMLVLLLAMLRASEVARYCKYGEQSFCDHRRFIAAWCKKKIKTNIPDLCPLQCGLCQKSPDCYGKQCLNGGSLDLESCTCICDFMYRGHICEKRCPDTDDSRCGQWISYCQNRSDVRELCPFMCGVCEKEKNKKNNPGLTSTTVPQKETTEITTTATSTTIATTALASQPIDGICPDTDRSLETWSDGETRLMDRKSAEGSLRPWTVIQRRTDGSVNFDKNWSAYDTGFGSKSSSFWLGLREIHYLCNEDTKCQLLINLKFSPKPDKVARVANGCYHASYSEFWLSGPANNYVTTVSGYRGTAGDGLNGNHNLYANVTGHAFSTKDKDNDSFQFNCAEGYEAGWWFTNCTYSCLNCRFGKKTQFLWLQLTGLTGALEFSEMKVRSKM